MNEQIDHHVPFELLHTQVWFGEIISRPLSAHFKIETMTPSGNSIEKEAEEWVEPSLQLKPFERIEIYNQVYWWRLLKIFAEIYPSLLRFFGREMFSQKIAIPYLQDCPPKRWLIRSIGDDLPGWINRNYADPDKELIATFAQIDLAMEKCFRAETEVAAVDFSRSPVTAPGAALSRSLRIHPDAFIFTFPWDLFTFRRIFLEQEVEYWQIHPFPSLISDRAYYHLVFRNIENRVISRQLSAAEFSFLSLLKKGLSIEKICDWIENEDSTHYEETSKCLDHWISGWLSEKIII